jgi:hypothetical protein
VWSARQAGQLPGGGQPVDCQRPRQPAHRLPPVSAEAWANDPARRGKAGVPDDVVFQTKPQIALAQIRTALDAGVAPATVLTDAGYGVDTTFRDGITELGLAYVVASGPPSVFGRRGWNLCHQSAGVAAIATSLVRRDTEHQPASAKELALGCQGKPGGGSLARGQQHTGHRAGTRSAECRVRRQTNRCGSRSQALHVSYDVLDALDD